MGRIEPFKYIDTFGERLKLVRFYFQLTQSDLADLVNLHQGTMTKIERHVFEPDQDVINQLTDLFSLNPLYLRHGRAPIFSKKLVFGDFFITDRNRKLQNLFSGEALRKIILYLFDIEKVREAYVISGKSVYDIFIFSSHLNYPHYLAFRTDIEEGTSIKKTLEQEDLKTYYVENSDLLAAFYSIYNKEYKSHRYNNLKNALQKLDIPENMHFLLEFSEEQILAPLIITQKDEEAVQNLFQFFITTRVNEKHIHAAMKRLREMRKSAKKTAL